MRKVSDICSYITCGLVCHFLFWTGSAGHRRFSDSPLGYHMFFTLGNDVRSISVLVSAYLLACSCPSLLKMTSLRGALWGVVTTVADGGATGGGCEARSLTHMSYRNWGTGGLWSGDGCCSACWRLRCRCATLCDVCLGSRCGRPRS